MSAAQWEPARGDRVRAPGRRGDGRIVALNDEGGKRAYRATVAWSRGDYTAHHLSDLRHVDGRRWIPSPPLGVEVAS
jgi:hypothetical protein